jgi:hypothetical protein
MRDWRDWGGLMARAEDGDRDAYRAVLENMTPYLRALASGNPAMPRMLVQHVLLTVRAIPAYLRSRPSIPTVAGRRS